MKWQMLYALIYAGAFCAGIAVAVWSFLKGYHLGAVLVGATAPPFALFAGMQLNNWRLIRTMIAKQGDPHT